MQRKRDMRELFELSAKFFANIKLLWKKIVYQLKNSLLTKNKIKLYLPIHSPLPFSQVKIKPSEIY